MNFSQFLADVLFPRSCVACKTALTDGVICSPCLATIPLHPTLFCATCDARLAYGKKTCHRDASHVIGGAGSYHDPVLRELIRQLKFKGIREAADPLASLMARYLMQCGFSLRNQFIIIPVPLSKRRALERGFNQAEEIARRLGVTMNIPIMPEALTRTRNTKPQTETEGMAERDSNVKNCFFAAEGAAKKNVLLIDDVTTSGATFSEAAAALKAAGAGKIVAVAAAKA